MRERGWGVEPLGTATRTLNQFKLLTCCTCDDQFTDFLSFPGHLSVTCIQCSGWSVILDKFSGLNLFFICWLIPGLKLLNFFLIQILSCRFGLSWWSHPTSTRCIKGLVKILVRCLKNHGASLHAGVIPVVCSDSWTKGCATTYMRSSEMLKLSGFFISNVWKYNSEF